jgi:hypothetical protein
MASPNVTHPAESISDEFDDLTEMESADSIMDSQNALATSEAQTSKPAPQTKAPPAKLTYADIVATMRAPGKWPRGQLAGNTKPVQTTGG